jgi:acetolactate synthase-1/2/3 large subunit
VNGAELLVKTAAKAGIDICFANPGTTEMPIVVALDSEPGIKPVLGLFEGVCTGAADGYGRMLDKPAMTLLHLGPGFADGIVNLHNARRAKTPVVNIIGEHATWHRAADPPLAMDIEKLASTVSGWQRTNKSPTALSMDLAEAVAASMYGQVSTLIVPNDYQWAESTVDRIAAPQFSFAPVDSDRIDQAARLMRGQRKAALIIGGRALRRRGLAAAARIKAVTGCDIITDGFPPYIERGTGLPDVMRVPYFPEPAIDLLSPYEVAVLASVKEPVAFFGYKGIASRLLPRKCRKFRIDTDKQNVVEVLEALADALDASPHSKISASINSEIERPAVPAGALTAEKACLTLAAVQPENVIIVDEGLTTSVGYYPLTAGLAPHSYLTLTGGALGYGMPCAVGAALACPDRPVINFEADGSAMYTLQALWTQARESLNVTTLICANRSYNILKIELNHVGVESIGPKALSLIELDQPYINWVRVAEGLGVPAVSVNTAKALSHELAKALSEPGPHLIEMLLI